MHGWDGFFHWGWMGVWSLVGLVLVAGVLWALIRPAHRASGPASPEDTLKRRYARGEIDEETYERMLTRLRE